MKKMISLLLFFVILTFVTSSLLAQNQAEAGFEKLKSLVGEWQSKSPDGFPLSISYEVVAGGSAVMETRVPVNEPSMISIFHLDGEKLRMTHYCSIGNQPRMLAEVPSGEIKNLNFFFVDATNLTKPTDGHMRNLEYTFKDNDHITQVWTWRENGKDLLSPFNLERKK